MSDSVKVQHAEQSEVWGQEDIAAAGGQIMPTPKLMDAKKRRAHPLPMIGQHVCLLIDALCRV
jgi:hypothetical protein